MASVASIDTISNSSGNLLLVNGYPRQPGRIIECLSSPCDGSVVNVSSGRYVFERVTGTQIGTTVYEEITGSSMNYVPPAGAKQVVYSFQFNTCWVDDASIGHYKFFIGPKEVTYARHSRSQRYTEDRIVFEWVISIGGVTDFDRGRLSAWPNRLNLHMQFRDYGASNEQNIHGTKYWDGAGGVQLGIPVLTITSMA